MGALCLSQEWLCLFTRANYAQDLFFFFLFLFCHCVVSGVPGHRWVGGGGTRCYPQGSRPKDGGKVSSLEVARRKGCWLIQGTCRGPALFSALAHSSSSGPSLLAPQQCVFRAPRDSATYQQVILSTEQTLDKWPILLTLYTLPVFTCSGQRERNLCIHPAYLASFASQRSLTTHTPRRTPHPATPT